jgi:hypothetical protein
MTFKSTRFPPRARHTGGGNWADTPGEVDKPRPAAKYGARFDGASMECSVCEVQILHRLVRLFDERHGDKYRERRLLLYRIVKEALTLSACPCRFHDRLPPDEPAFNTAVLPFPGFESAYYTRHPSIDGRTRWDPRTPFVLVDFFSKIELGLFTTANATPKRFRTAEWGAFRERVIGELGLRQ